MVLIIGVVPSSISNLDNIVALVDAINDGVRDGVNAIVENEVHHRAIDMLKQMKEWISREQMFAGIGLANSSTNRKRDLDQLLDLNWVEMKYPEIPTHPKQQYKRTHLGENILKVIGI